MIAGSWRRARAWLMIGAGLWLAAGAAGAAPLLLIGNAAPVVQAWPAVTMRADESPALTVEQVLAEPERFVAPESTHATLGLRKEAMWLRIPVELDARATAQRWVLDIDYSALNRIDVYVVSQGRVIQHAVLGNRQPFSSRPLASRSHAMAVELPPGMPSELLLRVQTAGGMILPITLNTPAAFHSRALSEQMLQGLLAGLALSLLVYSLGRWITLRDSLSLKYALLVAGSMLFSMFQFGIGAQYLWRDVLWIERHAGSLFAMMAVVGSFLFIEHALTAGPAHVSSSFVGRRFSLAMKGGALLTLVVAAGYAFDIIDTRAASAFVSLMGPLPALLGLPGAVVRARRGDSVGQSFLLAWAVYILATVTLIAVINGHLAVNFWTLHSFEFGATIDMLLFMRVLSLGTKAVHTAAQHAAQERDRMHSLAHSDSLTGLPNRRGLNVHLTTALHRCGPTQLIALYLLDLDAFKPVNDQYGHDVGDELLVAVARRLEATMRDGDVVARLGGDEFVIMATGLATEEQAAGLAQKMLDAFTQPFQLSQHTCAITLTVGYSIAPPDGIDPSELLKRADVAMYSGKQAGKGCARRGLSGVSAPASVPA